MDIIGKNFKEKLLALIATVVIWILVVSRSGKTMNFDIPVAVTPTADKILVSKLPHKINVTVKGNCFDFAVMKSRNEEMVFDLSAYRIGKNRVYISPRMINMPDNATVQKIVPEKLTIKIDERAETTVTVDPYLDGQPKKGYRVDGVSVTPETVKISGPKEPIEQTESVPTNRIPLTGRKQSFKVTTDLFLPSEQFSAVETAKAVTVAVDITRDVRKVPFKDVPLRTTGGKNIRLVPSSLDIVLRGPIDILEKLRNSDELSLTVANSPKKVYFTTDVTFTSPHKEVQLERIEKKRIKVIKESP